MYLWLARGSRTTLVNQKRQRGGRIVFNTKDELLIVQPTYLDWWLWVGGEVEANETPPTAAICECQEEIGITPERLQFAFVRHRSPKLDGQDESLQFVFVCEVTDDFTDGLRLDPTEIEVAKLVPVQALLV